MADKPTIREIERLLEQASSVERDDSGRSDDGEDDRGRVGPDPLEPLTASQRAHIAAISGPGVTGADIPAGTGATTAEITPDPGTPVGEDLTREQRAMLDALTDGRGAASEYDPRATLKRGGDTIENPYSHN